MNIVIFAIMIFFMALFILEVFFYTVKLIRFPDSKEVKKRLSTLDFYDSDDKAQNLLKKKVFSDVPFLNQAISYIPGVARLDLMIKQGNLRHTLGFFALCSIFLGLIGFQGAHIITRDILPQILIALFLGYLPFFYVSIKKNKRMTLFEKQLPEGLGLVARALRAGHAFTAAMKFASEEYDDPLGPEFDETLDEINFGVSVPDALRNLSQRVDCPDLKFFVVAVILQRETGGNLAEILENLAGLIRERFKFRGKVKSLTAEGKMNAGVLIAIPIFLGVFMYITNRQYIEVLFVDPMGKTMLIFGVVMIIIGAFIMRRIINIDV